MARGSDPAVGLQAQRDLERQIAAEGKATAGPPMAGPGYKMVFSGKWANSPGWKPRWMWTGEIVEQPAPLYVTVPDGVDDRGQPRVKRVAPPLHARRVRRFPKLVLADNESDFAKKINERWLDAEQSLPDECREMIVDTYYGDPACAAKGCTECLTHSGFTPAMRRLCAAQVVEREAASARKAEARPAARQRDEQKNGRAEATKKAPAKKARKR